MPGFVCVTCGIQLPESEAPPPRCPICEDERQFVPPEGQRWTTLEALRRDHRNVIRTEEPGLHSVATEPPFAIGQRALLVRTPAGNVLWDCISLLDRETVAAIQSLGGVSAIALSHPHFYGSMVEWSRAFDHAPIYLHAADREWVLRPDRAVRFWDGDTHALGDGLTLVRCGGHFAGGTVLHWRDGAEGRGVLLTGDVVHVARDRRWVSFMYSFPNLIPLDGPTVRRIAAAVEPLDFERIYGGWWGYAVLADAKAVLRRSVDRYLRAIGAATL